MDEVEIDEQEGTEGRQVLRPSIGSGSGSSCLSREQNPQKMLHLSQFMQQPIRGLQGTELDVTNEREGPVIGRD